ncbi:MAG: hypothetical protein AABZ10_15530 [Nitrospirota bacterium]
MTTKTSAKTLHKPHTSHGLLAYLKKQPAAHATLHDVQKSLSHIGVSLSKRVSEEREKR